MPADNFAFSIKACNITCSERSIPATIELVLPDIPANLSVSIVDISTQSYWLRWNPITDADSYHIQWALCTSDCSNVSNSDWQSVATIANDHHWYFNTQANDFYTLRVAACRNGICSDPSSPVDMPRNERSIRFIHSDNLGSPVTETNINGEEQ